MLDRPADEGLGSRALASARVVAAAGRELAAGRPVVLVHDSAASAHLVASARHLEVGTLELINAHSRGVLSVAMPAARMSRLGLRDMGGSPADGRRYGAPVDLVGHDRADSPADRVATIRALASEDTTADRLVTPGHVFPAEANAEGCLLGTQLPDAAYDLARLAGSDAGLYVELAEPALVPADRDAQDRLGHALGAVVVTIRDLVVDRERHSEAARRIVCSELPTVDGGLTAFGYRSNRTEDDYIAFVRGEPSRSALPVYVHSRCPVSDVFGGMECGCGERLRGALKYIHAGADGLILYSDHDAGRHLGHLIPEKAPPRPGTEVIRDDREREIAAVLRDLGVRSITLSANRALDVDFLEALGIEVVSAGLGQSTGPS